jgi:hypothetical protein
MFVARTLFKINKELNMKIFMLSHSVFLRLLCVGYFREYPFTLL